MGRTAPDSSVSNVGCHYKVCWSQSSMARLVWTHLLRTYIVDHYYDVELAMWRVRYITTEGVEEAVGRSLLSTLALAQRTKDSLKKAAEALSCAD